MFLSKCCICSHLACTGVHGGSVRHTRGKPRAHLCCRTTCKTYPTWSKNVAHGMFFYHCEQTFYRRRLRRVIAAPPNNLPKQSVGTLWASSPSQGSAGRVQGESNCNDFRRELYVLGHACWNKFKIACKTNSQIMFVSDFFMIWSRGSPEASWHHLGSNYQK